MESVATDTVLVVILMRKSIHICVCRHSLMESCVEHTDLRHCRKHSSDSLDAKNVGRIMERSENRALLKLRNNSISNELTAHKLFCAMHDAMTHSLDILQGRKHTVLLVEKSIKDSLYTDGMILDRHFLFKFLLACSLMLEASDLHSYPFDKTLCKKVINLLVFHIQKLILKGRASAIQN